MKKIISFILTMIMLLTCTSISVMAADTQSDTTNQDGKMTIGVSVYNLNDAEVRAFRNYFENYVGMAFDVRVFIFFQYKYSRRRNQLYQRAS